MFSEPVLGEKFFGRDEVLELLNKRISALKDGYRQNIALAGQSLSGKTSILHHFLYSIKDEDFITVYVEVIKEPFGSFANRFLATLLYSALTKSGKTCDFELDWLLEKARAILPGTYSAIRQVYSYIDKGEFDDAYFSLLSLTSVLKEEIKRSCVVILDEFDNLEHIGIKNPFLNFGKVIMIQKDTMYIVSSSRNQVIKKILSEKLSLLFGNFEIVKISGFDIETASLFIDTRLSGFEMDKALKKFLIAFTDGNPFYLNHMVKRTKEIASERLSNYIDIEVVAESIMDLVYNANGLIHQYLMNFILDLIDTKYKEVSVSALAAIATGKNRLPLIAKALKAKQGDASKILLQLSELGFISKNGVFYKIDDSVLEFWLKYVYQKRKELLVDGLLNRNDIFRKQVSSYITDFLSKYELGAIAKVMELFATFSNELVQIDSKSLKLPHFTKVEMVELHDSKRLIAASCRGKTWMAQVYEDVATENDILEYIKYVRNAGKLKVTNKIIISLRGIEENAMLLAKELKLSIWDITTLNSLFNIYGKKRVVI